MDINKIIQDRKERRKTSGEDFTPTPLVNEILDRLTDYNNSIWEEGKTFIDPACGDGQFLVEVLNRKLENGHTPNKAIKVLETIFGTDIMIDNIEICRLRLLKIISKHVGINTKEFLTCIKIVKRNIECTPLSKYPNGSLDYLSLSEEETFNKEITDQQAEKSRKIIIDKKLFDQLLQLENNMPEIIKEKKTKKELVPLVPLAPLAPLDDFDWLFYTLKWMVYRGLSTSN